MDESIARLKEHGYKLTGQRQKIIDIMENSPPLTAEEIWQRSNGKDRLNLSTVYRNLKILMDMNLIRKSNLSGQADRFELVRQTCNHIIKCLKCGTTQVFSECYFHQFAGEVEAQTQFEINHHHLELYGICPNCRG